MSYCMIVYNIAASSPAGLINQTFLAALKEFLVEGIIAFVSAYFIASSIAKKLAFKIADSKKIIKCLLLLGFKHLL